MSEEQPARVFLFDQADPAMRAAYEAARTTFRFFWREIAWDRRRIVPALDFAYVKVPFYDREVAPGGKGGPEAEHMWLGEVDFDGRLISGVLLNAPRWLKTVKEGDAARVSPDEISDWMYATSDEVYGAFTVNLMRSRMSEDEREEHDNAWGLSFGDPNQARLWPWPTTEQGESYPEHPLSENWAPALRNKLAEDSSLLHAKGDGGWALLHNQALAGSAATVKVLLEAGADVNAATDHGMTALQLARSLGWDRVVALLLSKGATG